MKIFVVDDEKASLFLIEKELKKICPNDEIKTFEFADDFLNDFKKEKPNIVFMDIEMPGINGIDLAKQVKALKEDVNIIFSTAYSEYALDALNLYASGYIVKPVNKKIIENALNNLRYPLTDSKDIMIKTFGNFDIFYKGNPVSFRSPKSKEILAYLVDRQGAIVSKKELGAIIYEDDYSRNTQRTLSRNIQYLNEDLINAGIKDFLFTDNGYYIDLSKASCDLIDYLENKESAKYIGEYMEQYSFGEERKYLLEK